MLNIQKQTFNIIIRKSQENYICNFFHNSQFHVVHLTGEHIAYMTFQLHDIYLCFKKLRYKKKKALCSVLSIFKQPLRQTPRQVFRNPWFLYEATKLLWLKFYKGQYCRSYRPHSKNGFFCLSRGLFQQARQILCSHSFDFL